MWTVVEHPVQNCPALKSAAQLLSSVLFCIEYLISSFLVFAEEGLLYRARYFGDSDLYQRAQKMGTPSCSKLSDIQVILHGH